MSDNIRVRPSGGGVDVATDVVDDIHYPIYKTAIGEDGNVSLVSPSTPFPINSSELEESLKLIIKQLEKINFQLALLTDVSIDNDEVK